MAAMPPTFRGTCFQCGYESPELTAGGFAILVTDRDEDRRRRAGESVPVVLHPFADFVLDEFGLSFHSTAWGGQLVEVQTLVCRDCGRATETRRLTAGGVAIGCGGCTAIAASGLVAGVVASFAIGNPFLGAGVGVALCVLVAAIIEFGSNRFVRNRYRERAAAVDTPRMCVHCGGWNCVRPGPRSGPFPCPDCGETAVRIVPVARSGGA
jgi:predicted RNA-binding Zn-ribbon protein involved in translation (DUF1610 family)